MGSFGKLASLQGVRGPFLQHQTLCSVSAESESLTNGSLFFFNRVPDEGGERERERFQV